MSKRTKIGIGVGMVVALILLVLLLIFFLNNPETTETVRDIVIIVLALETVITGALLIVFIIQLMQFIRMVRDDVKPLIESARETVTTARGTATFMSEHVAQPAIKASSYVAGIASSISVLVRMLPRRKK
jgi:hypothetical protein